jgi:hypothetical protein
MGFRCASKLADSHLASLRSMPAAKLRNSQNESGPAILMVDVPDDIIATAISEWFLLSQGLVQFEPGAGLEELLAAWPTLQKHVVDLSNE